MQPLSYICTVEKESGRRNVFVKNSCFVIFIIFRNFASEKKFKVLSQIQLSETENLN